MKTHKFVRKPLYVDAVRISETNMEEVAQWCSGTIETDDKGQRFVKVEVYRALNDRQTQGFVGDWVLFAGSGYKVYTPKAFDRSFDKVKYLTKEQADTAGIKPPHEPRPAYEAKTPDPRKLASKKPRPGMAAKVSEMLSPESVARLESLTEAAQEESTTPEVESYEDVAEAAAQIPGIEFSVQAPPPPADLDESIDLTRVDEEAEKDAAAQAVIEEFEKLQQLES